MSLLVQFYRVRPTICYKAYSPTNRHRWQIAHLDNIALLLSNFNCDETSVPSSFIDRWEWGLKNLVYRKNYVGRELTGAEMGVTVDFFLKMARAVVSSILRLGVGTRSSSFCVTSSTGCVTIAPISPFCETAINCAWLQHIDYDNVATMR